ncbi:MAG TPA: hypothetical protein VGR62_01895 [Candidatus Binatia bacterium]|nr:hypothetical protein [Candidatus Binatia bacterium]
MASLLLLATPLAVAAQCTGTQLCGSGAGPCVVTAACAIPAGSTFDVRPRALVVAQGVTLTVGLGTAPVVITAASVTLEAGARIVLQGAMESGGALTLRATGAMTARLGSVIDAIGSDAGGQVTLDAGGDVVLDGVVDVSCNAQTGVGGEVTVTSHDGHVTLGGNGIHANGGQRGELGAFGGTIAIAAATDVTVDAPVEASRGDCFFCGIDIFATAGTVITTTRGTLDVRGSGGLGGGGEIDVTAGTAVDIQGAVFAAAAGSLEEGGEHGGTFGVTAWGGDIDIAGAIDARGAEPDGDGGVVVVDAAGDVQLTSPIVVRTEGEGEGGAVSVVAGRSMRIASSIDARGGGFGGGLIEGEVAEAVDVLGTATLLADGRNGGPGGSTDLEGCRLDVRAGAVLSNLGVGGAPFAGTRLTAHAEMGVAGTLRAAAASGSNTLVSRAITPVILPSATIIPAARLVTDPLLACCESCPATTTTTSTTTTTTTTSSTSSSMATTSSSAPSSSSTSTSSTTSSSTITTSSSSTSTSASSTTSTSTTTSTSPNASPTTTTTLELPPCGDVPAGTWDAVTCRLALLRIAFDAQPDDALGGARAARGMRRHLTKAVRQIGFASTAVRSAPALRRAARELHRFDLLLTRAERRGGIASATAQNLRALSVDVGAAVSGLRGR